MPAYLVFICESVSDRDQLDTYWQKITPTFEGVNVKILAGYPRFKILEGNRSVEGVVMTEFPTWEEAEAWYDSPAYQAIRHYRTDAAKFTGLLVDGAIVPPVDRMPQTRTTL